MEQIPLWPDLDLTSEKSEVTEWVYVGQDHNGRLFYVERSNPDRLLVEEGNIRFESDLRF